MVLMILAAFLLAFQDGSRPLDVSKLIEQLDSEKVEEREFASIALRKMGRKVFALLETIASAGTQTEKTHRAADIVGGILYDELVAATTRRLPPLTLKYKGASLSDVTAEIKKQTGITIDASLLGDMPITVDIANMPFLEAVDRIGMSNNLTCHQSDTHDLSWTRRDVAYVKKPVLYLDKVRLEVTGTLVTTTYNFNKAQTGVSIWLDTVHEPQFKTFVGPNVSLVSVQYEDGSFAVIDAKEQNDMAVLLWRNYSFRTGTMLWTTDMPLEVKKLKSVKGRISYIAEMASTAVTISAVVGSCTTYGEYTFTFTNDSQQPKVSVSGHKMRFDKLIKAGTVKVIDNTGMEHIQSVSSGSDGFSFYGCDYVPDKITFDMITDFLPGEQEFEFTDIPLR